MSYAARLSSPAPADVSFASTQHNPAYPFIPDLASERIEIVADGASAIYGSDAVAGVINFITRKRYSGLEASARYGVADNYHTFTASALAGRRPFCTGGGVGAVLAVFGPRDARGVVGAPTRVVSVNEPCTSVTTPFVTSYDGVPVECARFGEDYRAGAQINDGFLVIGG